MFIRTTITYQFQESVLLTRFSYRFSRNLWERSIQNTVNGLTEINSSPMKSSMISLPNTGIIIIVIPIFRVYAN